jgi:hypothetical protein
MTTETKRRLLLSKWNGFDRVGDMREQLDAKDETIGDLRWQIEQLESALTDVKYWMHAAQFRRSWPLLRKVEEVLG